jgi:hypothetical protein
MRALMLRESAKAARAAGTLQRLLTLDDVWTGYLEATDTIPKADVTPLSSIAQEMVRLLARIEAELSPVLTALEKRPFDIEKAFTKASEHLNLPRPCRDKALECLNRRGGNARAAAALRRELPKLVRTETKLFERKISTIKKGRYVQGDLSRGARCGLGFAACVLGAAMEAWPLAGAGFLTMMEAC